MKGLILAGGLGARLRPLSHTGPKQLIPVANKPVLFYGIEDLRDAGIIEIGIIVGYTPERIKALTEAVGDGSKFGVKITYIEQDAPRGLAHAVGIAKSFIEDDDFVVYLGDNILKDGVKEFVETFKKNKPHASILLTEVDNPSKFGVAVLGTDNNVIDVEEKPKNPLSNTAIVGVYLFTKEIFKFIEQIKPGKKGELQLTDAIKMMVHSNEHRVDSHLVKGWWDDTGNAEDLLHANHLVLMDIKSKNEGVIEEEVTLRGHIQIGKGTIIKKGSVIKGPVIIGKNCKIGPNTYIGPYTSIGDDTEIEEGEIESSIILSNSTIKFNKKIVDSLIGNHTVIRCESKLPKGYRFVVGENSELII